MWFDALLKYPVEAYESGTLVFSNVAQPAWWVLGAGAGFAVIMISVFRGPRARTLSWGRQLIIAGLQSAVLVGAIGLLAGPVLQTSTLQPGANNIAILLDTSGSMGFSLLPGEQAGEGSRLAAAVVLLETLTPQLAELGDISMFTFDTSAIRREYTPMDSAVGPVDAEGGTRVIGSASSVLASFKGMPLAAVIILSDGADNDDVAVDTAALAAHGVPVHTIGFGPQTLPGEVQLADVRLAADAPPDSRVTAELVIEHASSGDAVVRVRDGRTLLAAQKVELRADSPTVRASVSFDSGSTGIRQLSFELEAPEGDSLSLNNQIDRLLTVSERRRRFLYLEGEPRWEYKFIRRAVAGDDVLEFVSWLRTSDRKTYRQGVSSEDQLAGGFPSDLKTLYGYDVIVLGSLAATSIGERQHEWLESFVSHRGGSLLALAGRDALADGGWDVRPLGAALPVVLKRQSGPAYGPSGGSARPTREGLASPLTQLATGEGDAWATLPPLGDYHRLGELKPGATTLLELVDKGISSPLLVTQPYGLGTTAILATGTTWRWRMRTPPEDPRHGLFWRQLLRQLAETAQRPRNVEVNLDGEGLLVRAWLRDEIFEPADHVSVSAVVSHTDTPDVQLNLNPTGVAGVHGARYVPGPPGVYRVDVNIEDANGSETITRFVRAGVTNREYFRPVQNSALLRRVAEVTGGRYWLPEEAGELTSALSFSGSGIRTIELMPLWNLPVFFILLIFLKLIEWSLRRYWGKI